MAAVVVIGSFNVDHAWSCATLPRPGETLAGAYASGPGGKGFNQAVAAARAGAATTFLCALGDDAGGTLARALAAADGIALHAAAGQLPTGTAGIFVDAQGRNCIVVGAGANGELDAAFIAGQRAAFAGARVVLAQRETPAAAVLAGLHAGREAGAATILNPAPANAACDAALLAASDVITPNETEFAALLAAHCGMTVDPAAVAACADATLHALCRELHPAGTVVVTLGAAGVFVSHGAARHGDDHDHARVAPEQVQACDTTGAGDAFNGALAAAWALAPTVPFGAHVRFANRYAALSTEHVGAARAMPQRAEVLARFGAAAG